MKPFTLVLAMVLAICLTACDNNDPLSSSDEISSAALAKNDKSQKVDKVSICHNATTAVEPALLVELIQVPQGPAVKHVEQHGDCVCDADAAAQLELPFCENATCDSALDENLNRIADGCETGTIEDADGDGVEDTVDNCPEVSNADQINTDGDPFGDACDEDDDGDGVNDDVDNCPLVGNGSQDDFDGDGIGDACDDEDGDGVLDDDDNCLGVSNPDQINSDYDDYGDACDDDDDNDGVLDADDNCPVVWNDTQADNDYDGVGDLCDDDDDNDGYDDDSDNCPFESNADQLDTDADGLGDECDDDDDGDEVGDFSDNCPLVSNSDQTDTDSDGEGDACDADDDGDGVDDVDDACPLVYGSGTDGCPLTSGVCPCWDESDLSQWTAANIVVQACQPEPGLMVWIGVLNNRHLAIYDILDFLGDPYQCSTTIDGSPNNLVITQEQAGICIGQIADRCADIGHELTPWWPTSEAGSTSNRK